MRPRLVARPRTVLVSTLAAWLVAVTVASADAVGQARIGGAPHAGDVRDPMGTPDLERFAARLLLSDAQLEHARRALDAYRATYAAMRNEEAFQAYLDRSREHLAVGIVDPRRLERVLDERDRYRARARDLDASFFDELATVLSEPQLVGLPRVRLDRRRARLESPGLVANFTGPVTDLSRALEPLVDDAVAAPWIDERLAEYERQLAPALARIRAEFRSFALDVARAHAEVVAFDAAGQPTADRWWERASEVSARLEQERLPRLRRAVERVRTLNDGTWRDLDALLVGPERAEWRRVRHQHAYPPLRRMLADFPASSVESALRIVAPAGERGTDELAALLAQVTTDERALLDRGKAACLAFWSSRGLRGRPRGAADPVATFRTTLGALEREAESLNQRTRASIAAAIGDDRVARALADRERRAGRDPVDAPALPPSISGDDSPEAQRRWNVAVDRRLETAPIGPRRLSTTIVDRLLDAVRADAHVRRSTHGAMFGRYAGSYRNDPLVRERFGLDGRDERRAELAERAASAADVASARATAGEIAREHVERIEATVRAARAHDASFWHVFMHVAGEDRPDIEQNAVVDAARALQERRTLRASAFPGMLRIFGLGVAAETDPVDLAFTTFDDPSAVLAVTAAFAPHRARLDTVAERRHRASAEMHGVTWAYAFMGQAGQRHRGVWDRDAVMDWAVEVLVPAERALQAAARDAGEAHAEIVAAVAATLEEKDRHDAAGRLRAAWREAIWPEVFDDAHDVREQLRAAAELDDLTDAQRDRLVELLAEHGTRYRALTDLLEREHVAYRDLHPMNRLRPEGEPFDQAASTALADRIARARAERLEASRRAAAILRSILTDEQLLEIPGLPASVER